jgi:hypothetical protein
MADYYKYTMNFIESLSSNDRQAASQLRSRQQQQQQHQQKMQKKKHASNSSSNRTASRSSNASSVGGGDGDSDDDDSDDDGGGRKKKSGAAHVNKLQHYSPPKPLKNVALYTPSDQSYRARPKVADADSFRKVSSSNFFYFHGCFVIRRFF